MVNTTSAMRDMSAPPPPRPAPHVARRCPLNNRHPKIASFSCLQVLSILAQNPLLPLAVTRDFLPRHLASSASSATADAAAAAELRESTHKMRAEVQGLR